MTEMHHLQGEQSPVAYEYVGDGVAYHTGVPKRDLTQDDVATLAEEQRALLGESPLYRSVGARGKKGEAGEGPKVDEQGHSLEPAPEPPPQDVPVREATGEDEAPTPTKTGARTRRADKE